MLGRRRRWGSEGRVAGSWGAADVRLGCKSCFSGQRPRGDCGGCEDWQSRKNGRGAGPASPPPLSPSSPSPPSLIVAHPTNPPHPPSHLPVHCQLCQTISFASGNTWTERSRVSAAAVGCSSNRPLGCLGFPVRERGLRCRLCITTEVARCLDV